MILKVSVCVVLCNVLLVSSALKSSNSVDDFSYTRHKRQIDNNKCTLPPQPENGQWKILNGNGRPGGQVSLSTVLIFECKPGYKPSSNAPSVCLGHWSSEVPRCEQLCPPLYPSNTYDLSCIDKIGKEVNCSEATHGTNLEYDCRDFYETPFGFKKTLFCEEGKWDSKPVCQPVCGKKIARDTNKLIYGSTPSEKIEYPWVTAVYQNVNGSYENICGGSILSQTVVLTAAHCVTNTFGDVLPEKNYLVGVGKLYRSYLAPGDTDAQYSELFKIAVPTSYKADARRFSADIAVLVVKEEFVLTEVVQPVCVTNLRNIHLHAGNKGEVAGWGLAEGDLPSEVLRSLVIPYKYETVCADELPRDWADRYNLEDKICAGFVNKSTSVCKGDSGGGLAFQFREDRRYYVHGVVSVGHKLADTCNIQQNSVYTKVASYYDFVSRLLTTYAPKVRDCVLPPFPQNGKWTTNAGNFKPGDTVPSNTVLRVKCDEDYELSSEGNIECSRAHNMPTCNKLCPILDYPIETWTECLDNNVNVIDCFDATDGTLLLYKCPPKYKSPDSVSTHILICDKGSWSSSEPLCIRIIEDCGKKIEGSDVEHPWNVGIYKSSDNAEEKYKYVCGGSLVSQYVVITSAQCVTDEQGNIVRRDDFFIAAGKFHGKYNDSRDTHTQLLNPYAIMVHPEYQKSNKKNFNVALLITPLPFEFNNFVQPVCLVDSDNEFEATKAMMIGWRFEDGGSSQKIEAIEVVYSKDTSCEDSSSSNSSLHNAGKTCVKFSNESTCLLPEDSGKAVVAKSPKDDRYYLRGIVDYYNHTGCQKNFWNTDLHFYSSFVDSIVYLNKRETENGECTLPPHPENGTWKLLNGNGRPGDQVPLSTILTFQCKQGYKLSSSSPSVCLGQWSSEVPECEKLCPPLYSSNTYDLRCIDKIGRNLSCSEATPGTNLEYDCRDFYETPFDFKKTLFCEEGKWDSKPLCQPVCGKKIARDTNTLIYGSTPSEKIEYPWVAAVYGKVNGSFENICGGSILSQTVVLTAAHCVTNSSGDVLPKENFLVGVGKLYRSYLAPGGTNAQYSLLKIAAPTGYKADAKRYSVDIAVLVVKKEFVISEVVQPVCFTNLRNIHLHAGNKGEVAEWGFAEGDLPSEVLRSLVIPYKYETVCADELPRDWADRYNLQDKICAGFVNKSTSVCKGDSGGGLEFQFREDNRYYVHGVVSVGHKLSGICNIQQNSIYTKVASYYDFVNQLLTKFASKLKDCVLPPFPKNGKWTTDAGELKPGDAVPSNTGLNVECDEGYKLSGKGSIECSSAHNMPTCNKLCPRVKFPRPAIVHCYDQKSTIINCDDATDGSILIYMCYRRYVPFTDVRNCRNGSWGSTTPKCKRIIEGCGERIEGSEMKHPWNVGIYKSSDTAGGKHKYICGGSLVSKYVIITSAQCVTDEQHNILRKEDLFIAAGKFYGKYEDSRDTHAQILNLYVIMVHPEYKMPISTRYNLALLITSSAFEFNNFVQPVCLVETDVKFEPTKAMMLGWRFEDEKIEALEVEYLNDTSCEDFSPSNNSFRSYERICVGFNKESATCLLPEDSGKGVVAKNPKDDRYYLRGIVDYYSNSGCQKNFWNTDLRFYSSFVDHVVYYLV